MLDQIHMRRKLKSFDFSRKDALRAIFTILKQNGDELCDADKLFNFFAKSMITTHK